MTSSPVIIDLNDVSCEVAGNQILHGIDLQLSREEITVIIGHSGSGKSTLLRTIAGFDTISSGKISNDTRLLSSPRKTVPPEDRKIGFVVQNYALFPHLSVRDNIGFGLDKSSVAEDVNDWLSRVGLLERSDAFPHELSGGEQQRVALARALVRKPAVVLLDEAFSSLDHQLRKALRREAKALLRGAKAAVLAVTHDADEALEFADNIVVLNNGRILEKGSPEQLYWRPKNEVTAQLLGAVNTLEGELRGNQFMTAFGNIDVPQSLPTKPSRAFVRPSAITIRANRNGKSTIVSREFHGSESTLTIAAENGETMEVRSDVMDKLEIGSRIESHFNCSKVGWSLA